LVSLRLWTERALSQTTLSPEARAHLVVVVDQIERLEKQGQAIRVTHAESPGTGSEGKA